MKKSLIVIFVVCLAITGFVGISALVSGEFDELTVRILFTTAALSFYSLIGLTCVAQLGRKTDMLGKLGLAFCAVALLHAIFTTWTTLNGLEHIQNRAALAFVGLAIAHACLMKMISAKSMTVSVLVIIAIASVVLNTILAISMLYGVSMDGITVLGIIGIIATCSTIAAPALNLASSD